MDRTYPNDPHDAPKWTNRTGTNRTPPRELNERTRTTPATSRAYGNANPTTTRAHGNANPTIPGNEQHDDTQSAWKWTERTRTKPTTFGARGNGPNVPERTGRHLGMYRFVRVRSVHSRGQWGSSIPVPHVVRSGAFGPLPCVQGVVAWATSIPVPLGVVGFVRVHSVHSREPLASSGSIRCVLPSAVRPGSRRVRLGQFGPFPRSLGVVGFVRVCSVHSSEPWRTSGSFGCVSNIPGLAVGRRARSGALAPLAGGRRVCSRSLPVSPRGPFPDALWVVRGSSAYSRAPCEG